MTTKTGKPRTLTMRLAFSKETASTYVFKASDEDKATAAVHTVYVSKEALGDIPPEAITLDVTY